MPAQQILQQKMSEVEEITQMLKQHSVIGIASLQKVRASQLQALKKNLTGKVRMQVIKNTLIRKAVENCKDKPELAKLAEHLTGANVFMFTDMNPFNLAITLEKGKIQSTAKAGDFAAFDIVVPTGNTGQPPGPIISQLNAVGLPTRIESGSVWVAKDTLVAKKGDVIDEKLAGVLSKLNIKAVELGIAMRVAFDEGLIITQEQLKIDVDAMKHSLENASADAFALSLSIAYPTGDNIVMLVQVAHREARALSLGASVPTKETIEDLVRKAHLEMLSLSSRLPTLEEKAGQAEKTEKS